MFSKIRQESTRINKDTNASQQNFYVTRDCSVHNLFYPKSAFINTDAPSIFTSNTYGSEYDIRKHIVVLLTKSPYQSLRKRQRYQCSNSDSSTINRRYTQLLWFSYWTSSFSWFEIYSSRTFVCSYFSVSEDKKAKYFWKFLLRLKFTSVLVYLLAHTNAACDCVVHY